MIWLIIGGGTFLLFLLCWLIFIYFDKWINLGESGAKHYTRLTLALVIISFATVLLMLLGTMINVYLLNDTKEALQAQIKGTPPINPELVIKLVDEDYNHFYFSQDLVEVYHNENWTFWPAKKNIRMIVRNNGQSDAGNVVFDLTDVNQQFYSTIINKNMTHFQSEYLEFDIWSKKCFGGNSKFEYDNRIKECNFNELPTGLMEWYLRIDCERCLTDTNPKCYKFKICVYNETQQKNWCKKQWKKEYEPEPYDCTKPFNY